MHLPLILSQFAGTDAAASKWAAVALGVVTLIYIVFVRPLRKGKQKDPLERSGPASPTLAQQRSIERELSNLLVEYEQMIRQMTAGVDTRAAKLELLMKDADEKTVALHAALAAVAAAGGAEPRGSSADPGNGAAGFPLSRPTDPFAPPARSDAPDPRHADVYSLADEGGTPQEIARRLGRHRGEIELILALRTKAK